MKQKNTFQQPTIYIKILMAFFALGIGCLGFILFISFILGPPLLDDEQNTVILSHDEKVIGYEHGLENRRWVPLEDISEDYIQATITAEDRRFFNHYGFDIKRIVQAILKNIKTLSLKEGASTLTQQYARNLYLTHEKTWQRKIKEAFYAIRLEMFYSKEELLEGYMNTIYFGQGIYGIETASQYFFNKPAK